MYITKEQLVESYGKSIPKQRFTLIYKNYGVFLKLVKCYEVDCSTECFEREYNLRAKNGDNLGIRIQTNRLGDSIARQYKT